jgi:iron complex outermembrane receptor protein
VGVRGFGRPGDYNSRILVLVDGHRVNEDIYQSVGAGADFPLDVDLIDRIEIVRGPGSSVYGSSAVFAVVSIMTKKAAALGRVELSAEAASHDAYTGRLTWGQRFPDALEISASGTASDSKGHSLYFPEFDAPQNNNGVAEGADGERYHSLFGSVSWRGFTLQATHVDREKGIPTAAYGTAFGDTRSRTTDVRSYIDLSTERSLGAGVELSARTYMDRASYDGDYAQAVSPVVINHDYSRGEWWGVEAAVTSRRIQNQTLLAGATVELDTRASFGNYDADPFVRRQEYNGTSNRWAVFGQDEIRLGSRFLFNLGVRYDSYSSFGGKASPRVAAIYSPDAATAVKVLYGQAFRAPSVYELYYDAYGQKPNPLLQPETIRTFEAVLERAFSENLRLGVSAFQYSIDGLISFRTDPTDGLLQYTNADQVEASGVEVEAAGTWKGLSARASYSYQDARDKTTDGWLTNSPNHLAKLQATVSPFKAGVSAGLEVLYMGPRLTLGGNTVGGFVLTNLTLVARPLVGGLSLSAGVQNLFDKRYSDPGSEEHVQDTIPQDGRSFRVKLSYRF